MTSWQPIEEMVPDSAIWVIKYTLYTDDLGNFVDATHHEASPFTDCHGWYESEEDARKVVDHFPKPNTYRVEKVWKRRLK